MHEGGTAYGNKVVIYSLQRPGLSSPGHKSNIGLLSSIQPTCLQGSLGWVAARCIWALARPQSFGDREEYSSTQPRDRLLHTYHLTFQLFQLAVM